MTDPSAEIPEPLDRDAVFGVDNSPDVLAGYLKQQIQRNFLRMRAIGILPTPETNMSIQLEVLLSQVFPGPTERIKFEIACEMSMEQRITAASEQAEMARAEQQTAKIRAALTDGVPGIDLSKLKREG